MAYKATQSRAPAAPSMYKAESNKFLGIDSSTSDDNVSLLRACGISYFDIEQQKQYARETPGMCNLIRTNIGEVGKRCGRKEVTVSGAQVGYVTNIIYNENVTILFDCGISPFGLIRMLILRPSDTGYTASTYTLDNFAGEDGAVADVDKIHNCTFCEIINDKIIAAFEPDRLLIADIKADSVSGIYISAQGAARLTANGRGEFVDSFTVQSTVVSNEGWYNSQITIPRIYIGNVPSGGSGKGLEPVNLLNPFVLETFAGDGTALEYTLSLETDNTDEVFAFVLDDYGAWIDKNITVSSVGGKIKVAFSSSDIPPAPTVSGEDNVRIYYRRKASDFEAGLMKITGCKISASHGVGGYKDRLFLSGNDEYPNFVWYSEMDNYTYISDRSYLTFSDRKCRVMALAGQDISLAVITDGSGYLVGSTANTGDSGADFEPDALFTVSRVFSSPEPASLQKPQVFDNEILYLSKAGLCAITPSDIMDERCVQVRSEYVNRWLLKENLKDCTMCVVGDFLIISSGVDGEYMYIFDGAQYSRNASKPFAYRQFESYIFAGCKASFVWQQNGMLYMLYGANISSLSFDCDANDSYTELSVGGQTLGVNAYWETPNIYGADFYNKKSFAKFGVLLRKMINYTDNHEINTTVRVWYKRNNDKWKLLRDYNGDQCIFRYDYINYSLFSYRPVGRSYTVNKKIKIKKTYSLKLRFENDIAGMPLFLQAFGLEYTM